MGPMVAMLRNDCAPALAGLSKGSSRSPQLQGASLSAHKQCHAVGWILMTIHVSGQRLIEEGVDDGSRLEAKRIRGPKTGALLRDFMAEFCRENGVELTIDFFASTGNAITPRFASWTQEPASEAVDAFSMRSWESSVCPSCQRRHKETGFFFPPSGLESRVVMRARSDGARGLFLVPSRQRAGFWLALRRDAVAWCQVPRQSCVFDHANREMGAHTLFLVDFHGPGDSDEPCAAAGHRRAFGRPRDPVEEYEAEELRKGLCFYEEQDQARPAP